MNIAMRTVLPTILIILAAVCGIYGVCICMLHSGSMFYAVWWLLAVVLAVVAVVFRRGMVACIPMPVRVGFCALVLLGLGTVVVTFGLMLTQFHAAGDNDPNVILVLGAQVRTDGPSRVLRYRLDAAYDYLVAHPDVTCIVTGGQGANEPEPEGDGMARYLIERGIDADRILIENESKNTAQNMSYSAALIDPATDRVAIVTNNFHVYRSIHLARKAGYQNVSGLAARSDAFYLPNNMLRETCGILKDLLAGNM